MKEVMLGNGFLLVVVIALIELVLSILFWKMYGKDKRTDVLLLAMLCTGLVYDACVIALGKYLPEGNVAILISKVRYILSGVFIPLLLPVSAIAMKLDEKKRKVAWIVAVILMIPGIIGACLEQLQAVEVGGVVRYASSPATPKWVNGVNGLAMLLSVVALIAAGVHVLRKEKKGYLLLAGVCMLGFSVLGASPGYKELMVFLSMIGEACMMLFLWLHEKKYNCLGKKNGVS